MCVGLEGRTCIRPKLSSRDLCEDRKGRWSLTCSGGEEGMERRRRKGRDGLTFGQARGAAVAPAQSPCSADTAHTAAGKPDSAPSAKAPHEHLAGAHPRPHSSWRPLCSQALPQGDGAAAGVEIKEGSPHCQPPRVEEWRSL